MKSMTKYREKLSVNETLRKRCDINSDREKPKDSHDFLKLPHRNSIIKSLKYNKKRGQPRNRNLIRFFFKKALKMLPKIIQNL